MAKFDDYIYKLKSESLGIEIILSKDLIWPDELTWSKIVQEVEWSVTGALLVQEGVKLKGRDITLISKDNMAWVSRSDALKLVQLRDSPELVMKLSFEHKNYSSEKLFEYNVRFRHSEGALDLANIKDFDSFETDALYIVKSIKLMEV